MKMTSFSLQTKALIFLVVLLPLFLPNKAWAVPIELIFENNSAVLDNKVFSLTYNSVADFVNANTSSSEQTSNNFQTGGDIAGFTYDGAMYHLIFENNSAVLDNKVFLLSFATLNDFNNGNIASTELTLNNFQTAGDIAGFTYDGSQYHLLFENSSSILNNDVFLLSYDSIADFIGASSSSSVKTAFNLQTGGDIAGFAFDGNQYHIAFENDPSVLNNNVFLLSFDSLSDVENAITASSILTSNNFQTGGDISGFEAINDFSMIPSPIPEPTSLWLVILGLSSAFFRRRLYLNERLK